MNYIVGQKKPYYLVRMIPFDESFEEVATTLAFPLTIMFKLWTPGEPMPDDLLREICDQLGQPEARRPILPPASAPSSH
jgi:hypothetical protein